MTPGNQRGVFQPAVTVKSIGSTSSPGFFVDYTQSARQHINSKLQHQTRSRARLQLWGNAMFTNLRSAKASIYLRHAAYLNRLHNSAWSNAQFSIVTVTGWSASQPFSGHGERRFARLLFKRRRNPSIHYHSIRIHYTLSAMINGLIIESLTDKTCSSMIQWIESIRIPELFTAEARAN